jgi:hypothetical protein
MMAGEAFGALGEATSRFYEQSRINREEQERKRQFDETMKLNREQLALQQQATQIQAEQFKLQRFDRLEANLSDMDGVFNTNVKYMDADEQEAFGAFLAEGRQALSNYYATGDEEAYKQFAQKYQNKPFGQTKDGKPITMQSILGSVNRRKVKVDFDQMVQGSSLQSLFNAAGAYITDPNASPDQKEWGKNVMSRLQKGESVDMGAEFAALAVLNQYGPQEILKKVRDGGFSIDSLWIAEKMLKGAKAETPADEQALKIIQDEIERLKQPTEEGQLSPWDEYEKAKGAPARTANLGVKKLSSDINLTDQQAAQTAANTRMTGVMTTAAEQDIYQKAEMFPLQKAQINANLLDMNDRHLMNELGLTITREGWVFDKDKKQLDNQQLRQLIEQQGTKFGYEVAYMDAQTKRLLKDIDLADLQIYIGENQELRDAEGHTMNMQMLQQAFEQNGLTFPFKLRTLAAETTLSEDSVLYEKGKYDLFMKQGMAGLLLTAAQTTGVNEANRAAGLANFATVQDLLYGAVEDGRPDVLGSAQGKQLWMQENRSNHASDEDAEAAYQNDIKRAENRYWQLQTIRQNGENLTAARTKYDTYTANAMITVFEKYGLTNMMGAAELESLKTANDKQAALIYQKFMPKLLNAQYTGELAGIAAELADLPNGAGLAYLDGMRQAGILTDQQAAPLKRYAEIQRELFKSGVDLKMRINVSDTQKLEDEATLADAQRPYLTILGQKSIWAEINGKKVNIVEAEQNLAIANAVKDLLPAASRQELLTKIAMGQYDAAVATFKTTRINWDAALQDSSTLLGLAALDPEGSLLQYAPFAEGLAARGGTAAYQAAIAKSKADRAYELEVRRLSLYREQWNNDHLGDEDDATTSKGVTADSAYKFLKGKVESANKLAISIRNNPQFKQAADTIKNITGYDVVADPVTGRSLAVQALNASKKQGKPDKDLEAAITQFDGFMKQYQSAIDAQDKANSALANFDAGDKSTWGMTQEEINSLDGGGDGTVLPIVTPKGKVGSGNTKLYNPYGNNNPKYRTAYVNANSASGYTPEYISREIASSIGMLTRKQNAARQPGWFSDAGPLRAYNGYGTKADGSWMNPGYVNAVKGQYDKKPWIQAIQNAKGDRKSELAYINQTIESQAKAAGIEPDIVKALMWHESGGWKVGEYNGADGGIGQINGYTPPAPMGYKWNLPKPKTPAKTTTKTTASDGVTPPPTPMDSQSQIDPDGPEGPVLPKNTTNTTTPFPPLPAKPATKTTTTKTPAKTTPPKPTPKVIPTTTTPTKPATTGVGQPTSKPGAYQYKGNVIVGKDGKVNQKGVNWILGDPRFKKLVSLFRGDPDALKVKTNTQGDTVATEIIRDIATRFLKDNNVPNPDKDRVDKVASEIMVMASQVTPEQTREPTRLRISDTTKRRIRSNINNDAVLDEIAELIQKDTGWTDDEVTAYIEDVAMGRVK